MGLVVSVLLEVAHRDRWVAPAQWVARNKVGWAAVREVALETYDNPLIWDGDQGDSSMVMAGAKPILPDVAQV